MPGSAGSTRKMSAPFGRRLAADAQPPWALAMASAMARPSPAPSVERAASSRANLSKARGRKAGEKPGPSEPGVVEQKYYAPGVGLIREETVEGGSERMDLIEYRVPQ